jgi:GT2 family glycosyltransferase
MALENQKLPTTIGSECATPSSPQTHCNDQARSSQKSQIPNSRTQTKQKLKRKLREFAYSIVYKIKTSRTYQRLRHNRALHEVYMTLKTKLKKARKYEISLSDDQLKAKVEAYLLAKRGRGRAEVVVYTAVIDNYDTLKIPLSLNPDWDYVCFTDRAEFAGNHPWEVRPIPYIDSDSTRCARFVKIRPDICLPEYKQSIWIDANILIRDDFLDSAFDQFSTSSYLVAGIPHSQRNCTYEEFKACKELTKDSEEILNEQESFYQSINFKPQCGMIETNLFFRKHLEPSVVEFQKNWWKLLNRFSRRDQLSIVPALQSASLEWMEIMPRGMFIANHPSFYIFFHGAKWSAEAIQYKVPGFLPRAFCASTEPFWNNPKTLPFTKETAEALPRDPVDIVICVHNAPEDVDRCLQSVLRYAQSSDTVIVVDDGSETETATIIDRYAQTSSQIRVLRHDTPIGYTRSANAGLQASTADLVILLNSDTIVTENWSRKLFQVAQQAPHIGIVGPLSNAASFQSIPRIRDPKTGQLAINEIQKGKTIEEMNVLCEQYGYTNSFPLVPLVNGFCMGIRRTVIETIGYFDEESFPMGYGEEDDYTQRALDAGFMHAIATHCYVYHAKSKSFGSARRTQLVEQGREKLSDKHGELRIQRAVSTMANHPILGQLRGKICQGLRIKDMQRHKLYLSRYQGLVEDNVQSIWLSAKQSPPQSDQTANGHNSAQAHNLLVVIGHTTLSSDEIREKTRNHLNNLVDSTWDVSMGTIDNVFHYKPQKVLLYDLTAYSKSDIRELISFCKSRNIPLSCTTDTLASSKSPKSIISLIRRHVDCVLD